MKRWVWKSLAGAAALAALLTVPAAAAGDFTDVPPGAYYQEAVDWAVDKGITSGVGQNAFAPDAVCTRAEAVTFLWRAAGSPKGSGTIPFRDVSGTSYYYDAVRWAVEEKITSGTGEDTFSPDMVIDRAQAVCFLHRYTGSETVSGRGTFSDVPSGAYYAGAVQWAVSAEITTGTSAKTFSPAKSCTRAEIVTFLYRTASAETDEKPVLSDLDGARAAIINGFLNLENPIDVSAYHVEASALEALAAEIADVEGENYYYILQLWCPEPEGELAETLQLHYQYSSLEEAARHRQEDTAFRERVEEIVSSVVEPGMSEYETAKALHDYLVLNCEYDMRLYSGDMPDVSYTAYGALMNNTAVCAGYARAYQELLMACGMECEYVTGYGNGGRHGWNIVNIDGEWYHVDTTWDDPIPDREGYVRYNYFLRSDAAMGADHSNWKASHACTSTKYDGVTLPSSTEQAKQEEQLAAQQAEQERLDGIAAEIIALCTEAMDSFPYSSAAALQAAETLTDADVYVTIPLPSGEYIASDLNKVKGTVSAALSAQYPDYELTSISASGCKIKRGDVAAELERRKAIEQAETDVRVAEIEALVQEGIREGDIRARSYEILLPSGYTNAEVKKACSNMSAAGYSFDGYTAKEDYSISSYTVSKVTVQNLRWSQWAEEETTRYLDIIQEAIRNKEPEVVLEPGDYPDVKETHFAVLAANRIKAEGYSFDGLTSGVDFIITRTFGRASPSVFVVQIEYPNVPETVPEDSEEPELPETPEEDV